MYLANGFDLVVYYLASRQAASSKTAKDQTPTRPYIPLLAFLFTLILIAGPWFVFIILRFNRINELGLIPGLAASLGVKIPSRTCSPTQEWSRVSWVIVFSLIM